MSLTSTASASASASASRTSDADHSIASGSGSGRGIVEPVFSPVVQEQLNQMRRAIIERIQREGGVHYTADFSSPLQHHHWRTIYQRYKHRTTIVPTPDPRADPAYQPPCLLPTWPDWHLHRFLRARKFVVSAAVDMFVNMLAWHVEFGVDDLRAQPVSPWQDIRELLVPECTHATDKAGRPLYVAVYGPMDAERLTAEIAPPMQWVLEVHRLEQFDVLEQRLSVETGQRVTSLAWLLDASGCTLGHFGLMPWVRATSEVGQPYYPDFMGQLVVINVPSFFPVLWRVCGAWFDQRVRDEMCLLGSDYQHELRERIGAAGLCREYGGDCNKCGGHCAPSLQPFQDKQQQQRQQQQHEVAALLQSGQHHSEHIRLPASRAHTINIDLTVPQPLSSGHPPTTSTSVVVVVYWAVAVQDRSASFSLWFVPGTGVGNGGMGEAAQRIGPERRVEAGVEERGCRRFVLDGEADGGVAQLRLSNGGSRWRGKEVTVAVQYGSLVEPASSAEQRSEKQLAVETISSSSSTC